MTETELIDRLREAIVLDGPDAWRSNGYLQDAQQAGLTLEAALKRASEVSQEVQNNSILFQNIHARIARLAQPSRSHLISQDLAQIVNAASSLNLSPDFVRNRWVPSVLARITKANAPQQTAEPVTSEPDRFEELIESEPEPPKPTTVQQIDEPAPTAEPPQPPAPIRAEPEARVNPEPVRVTTPAPEPVRLPEPPTPIVRKYTASPARIRRGQAVTLEWEVENLLAVTIDDLGEGLSPKNRGWVKPTKTTDYTLFDANNNPLSTVRVEVIPRDRSGVYGVLFALALLALIYWFIKSSNSQQNDREPERRSRKSNRTEQTTSGVSQRQPEREVETPTTDTPLPPADEPASTVAEKVADPADEAPKKSSARESTIPEEPTTQPATPADARNGKYEESFGNKPYDKVELGTDDQGWRRARSNGRWGFINEADEWVIEPQFEAVTPFKGNTAGAFLNGQLISINRNGEQIRQ
ncbi:WG repeat-containing protein [Spirosoma fluminis]